MTSSIYDLDDETTYYLVVRAFGTSGNESPDSDEVCYQPAEKNDPLTQGDDPPAEGDDPSSQGEDPLILHKERSEFIRF